MSLTPEPPQDQHAPEGTAEALPPAPEAPPAPEIPSAPEVPATTPPLDVAGSAEPEPEPTEPEPTTEQAEPNAQDAANEPRSHRLSWTPPVDPHLTAAGDALRAAVARAEQTPDRTWSRWDSAHLEWSQAGTQHSGRTYLITPEGVVRLEVPDAAVSALAALRAAKADPTAGAWLAAYLTLTPGSSEVTSAFEWTQRPYWNAPGLRMVPGPGDPVPAQPMPTDEQWLADLRTYPRSPELVPDWLRNSTATPGAASAALRSRLGEVGYPAEAVLLPGESVSPLLLEGAMEVRAVGSRFEVGVRDYGVFEPFHTAATEREACDWLWEYLSAPIPAATPVPRQDLDARSAAYRPSYAQLYSQLQAGGGAILTTLPPGVALDRIGALDGVFLFPWATPIQMRSLPPNSSPNVRLFQVLTTRPLTVEAEIVQPWFEQPGGSLRFRLAQDGEGIRQLVQSGALLQVTVGP